MFTLLFRASKIQNLWYDLDIINKKQSEIEELSKWVDSILKESIENTYSDIDNVLYEKGVRNLERVIESKMNIQKTLTENKVNKVAYYRLISTDCTVIHYCCFRRTLHL